MSPEQVLAQDVDARTDIWAFGTVLYEMRIGHHPFRHADFEKSLQAILNEEPATPASMPPTLPSDLDWILRKTLAKRREERCQHVDDLVTDIRVLHRGLTVEQQALTAGRAGLADAPTVTIKERNWLRRFLSRH